MDTPSPNGTWASNVSGAASEQTIQPAWNAGEGPQGQGDDVNVNDRNRCGQGGRTSVAMLRVTLGPPGRKPRRMGHIMYHDFLTNSFLEGEGVKEGENKAVFRFCCGDREQHYLVITGVQGKDIDDEDFGVGKYAAQIRAGTLSTLFADGNRIKDVGVENF